MKSPSAAAPHFLDTLPFDLSRPAAQDLLGILAAIYWKSARAVALLQKAGISPGAVNFDQPMSLALVEILTTARSRDRLRSLIDQVLADPDAEAWHERIRELLAEVPAVEVRAPVARVDEHEPRAGGRERQLEARPTLLDVAFLAKGLRVAPAVARIWVQYASGSAAVGTAFRIGQDLLLTNHHVLFDRTGPATSVAIWFKYETDLDGHLLAHDVHGGEVESIAGDAEDDWAVVRASRPLDDAYPILGLGGTRPLCVDDRVYIIQHPRGGPKQIGLHHNDVRYLDEKIVQYRTDTEGGSSGSPVFNERWEVVALHHSWERARGGGTPPQLVNEGIRIERVVRGLSLKGITR
jgi:endonuclease G